MDEAAAADADWTTTATADAMNDTETMDDRRGYVLADSGRLFVYGLTW